MTAKAVHINADVAELADALDSGSSESNFMWVQLPSSAPCENTLDFRGCFCAVWVTGVEGETAQSGLPVDVRDRGRPSAQFARESTPVIRTKKRQISTEICRFLFKPQAWYGITR